MTTHKLKYPATAYGIFALLVVAGSVTAAPAQQAKPQAVTTTPAQKQTAGKSTAVNEEEREAGSEKKPGGEGIRVHGHWVLQVKNSDGTLGERREFDNSLVAGAGLGTTSGDQLFAGLLSGNIAPGGMAVAFINGPVTTAGIDTSSFCNSNPNAAPVPAGISCYMYYSTGLWTSANTPTNKPTTPSQSGLTQTLNYSPTVSIILSGNYSVPSGLTEIDGVQSYLANCSGNGTYRFTGSGLGFGGDGTSPSACASGTLAGSTGGAITTFGALTSTSVPSPLKGLTPGQVIQVSVTISFS